MINVAMWPALKAGQLIYYVQYDGRKNHWEVVACPVKTLLKKLDHTSEEEGKYKYRVETRGNGDAQGFEFHLPDEDFFFAEEDAQNTAVMYNLRSKVKSVRGDSND